MASDKNISISSDGASDPDLRIILSKGQFSDFLLGVIKTQRLEKREWKLGFDLTKDAIRILIEKLLFQVKRVNDLIHEDVSVTVTSDRGESVEFSTFIQFLTTEWQHKGKIVSCQINASLVVGFSSPNTSEREYFKQRVSIEFKSGAPGEVIAQVESNDLSWPSSIFQLIELSIADLSEQIGGSRNLHGIGADLSARIDRIVDKFSAVVATVTVVTMFAGLLGFVVLIAGGDNSSSIVFDSASQALVAKDVTELVRSLGPDEAAKQLSVASTLKSAGIHFEGVPKAERIVENVKSLPAAAWLAMIFFGALVFWWNRFERKSRLSKIGRIFFGAGVVPARENVKVSDGLGMAIVVGVVTGLATSLIWKVLYG